MASEYRVQIVHMPTGDLAHSWSPGSPAERQFEDAICDRLAQKGIGIGRTQAQVIASTHEAIREVLFEIKARVRP